jgi:primosomal replication protein N
VGLLEKGVQHAKSRLKQCSNIQKDTAAPAFLYTTERIEAGNAICVEGFTSSQKKQNQLVGTVQLR